MIGRQHAMTGQISAAWNVFLSIPARCGVARPGEHSSGLLEDKGADQAIRILFFVGAAIMGTVVAVFSRFGGQKDVFNNLRVEDGVEAGSGRRI